MVELIQKWYDDHPNCILYHSAKNYCIIYNPDDVIINWTFYPYKCGLYEIENNIIDTDFYDDDDDDGYDPLIFINVDALETDYEYIRSIEVL